MIAKDVRNFLKRFETTLMVLARDGRHLELDARLNDFQKLLGAWLDVAPPDTTPPERMRIPAIIDRFGGPLEINAYDIAKAATLSKDSSTVVTLAIHLLHAAFKCLDRKQARFMEEYLKVLADLYYQCVQSEPLADALGKKLDEGLYFLHRSIRSQIPEKDDGDGASDGAKYALLDVILRFALSLTHTAIRYEQTQHALYFVESIFEHRKYKQQQQGRVCTAPITMTVEALYDYVAIVLTGWSLHILQSGACKDTGAAKAVLSSSVDQLPALPVLLAEWELLQSDKWLKLSVYSRLGIGRWDIRDWNREYRAGVSVVRSGDTDWVRLGLRAALLKTETYQDDQSMCFSEMPKRFIWDAAQERNALENLASDEWLGIPKDMRQKRVDAAMRIIERRARMADADYLRYVLNEPLSEERERMLREEVITSYRQKQDWQNALRACGMSSDPPTRSPLRTRCDLWVPREYLLDGNNQASGFGERQGKYLAIREAMDLIYLIETSAERAEVKLDALARLPEVVRAARRQMINAGFSPNVLILSREERFAGALFRKPLWQVERQREFGEASIGVWEKMHVLRFPYSNPKSILLIDTTRAIAESEPTKRIDQVKVWIEENPDNKEIAKEIAKNKAAAKAALESEDVALPESSSIQVFAWIESTPRLAIVDTHAALGIDISNSDGGYALPHDSDLYHRPSCADIEFEDVEYVLRLPPASGRKPCPTCRPDQWNAEGRRGKLEGEEDSAAG